MHDIDAIEALYLEHGQRPYDGQRRESVSALEHALQCAQLAEWARADDALVAAAFLHDIGHFVTPVEGDLDDDRHETVALPALARLFGPAVLEPIRLHVAAKRYLVATDPQYLAALSPASVHSLGLQGGPMSAEEVAAFEATPHALDAVQLRRWDDLAKTPGQDTPSLDYYLALLEDVQR
ncbi:MAG: HD domain-containing protein [Rhizobacter sp.]|nr:HD domain-containing protein [Rhizobacter sp.]